MYKKEFIKGLMTSCPVVINNKGQKVVNLLGKDLQCGEKMNKRVYPDSGFMAYIDPNNRLLLCREVDTGDILIFPGVQKEVIFIVTSNIKKAFGKRGDLLEPESIGCPSENAFSATRLK